MAIGFQGYGSVQNMQPMGVVNIPYGGIGGLSPVQVPQTMPIPPLMGPQPMAGMYTGGIVTLAGGGQVPAYGIGGLFKKLGKAALKIAPVAVGFIPGVNGLSAPLQGLIGAGAKAASDLASADFDFDALDVGSILQSGMGAAFMAKAQQDPEWAAANRNKIAALEAISGGMAGGQGTDPTATRMMPGQTIDFGLGASTARTGASDPGTIAEVEEATASRYNLFDQLQGKAGGGQVGSLYAMKRFGGGPVQGYRIGGMMEEEGLLPRRMPLTRRVTRPARPVRPVRPALPTPPALQTAMPALADLAARVRKDDAVRTTAPPLVRTSTPPAVMTPPRPPVRTPVKSKAPPAVMTPPRPPVKTPVKSKAPPVNRPQPVRPSPRPLRSPLEERRGSRDESGEIGIPALSPERESARLRPTSADLGEDRYATGDKKTEEEERMQERFATVEPETGFTTGIGTLQPVEEDATTGQFTDAEITTIADSGTTGFTLAPIPQAAIDAVPMMPASPAVNPFTGMVRQPPPMPTPPPVIEPSQDPILSQPDPSRAMGQSALGLGDVFGAGASPFDMPMEASEFEDPRMRAMLERMDEPEAPLETYVPEPEAQDKAEGGIIEAMQEMPEVMQLVQMALEAPDDPQSQEIMSTLAESFGEEELQQLIAFLQDAPAETMAPPMQSGGKIPGNGDAMADDIRLIADAGTPQAQPIDISSGEFVIAGDVVSHLGSGNTDRGAAVLEQFQKDVRMNRTGTDQQAPPIDLQEVLPGTYGDRYA